MLLVDSHCHLDRLDLGRYGGDLAAVLDSAATAGVTHLLSVATDLEGWPALARLTEPYPQVALSVPEPSSPALQRLCRALRAQPDEVRPLAQWAHELAMDVRTLQRRFVRETGLTVGQWRRQCRLLLACEHLARGESVLEVALALGYASPSAFSAMFKRELGVAPSLFYR